MVPWGCIASPLFEPETPEGRFERELRDVAEAAREDGGIILGIADQAVERTLPERIRRVGGILAE